MTPLQDVQPMSKPKQNYPTTNAMRVLREAGIAFEVLPYKYQERGGTRHSAEQLGVDEHTMIKTLVMEDDERRPLIVLMHGDREVSTKNLAREMGVKSIRPCSPAVADKHSGYFVGGTSPLGTRHRMPVFAEATIFDLPQIHLNAGHRGLMLRLCPQDLRKALDITLVNVAIA
jgi:Cys-tRNA(Pro) deacylase